MFWFRLSRDRMFESGQLQMSRWSLSHLEEENTFWKWCFRPCWWCRLCSSVPLAPGRIRPGIRVFSPHYLASMLALIWLITLVLHRRCGQRRVSRLSLRHASRLRSSGNQASSRLAPLVGANMAALLTRGVLAHRLTGSQDCRLIVGSSLGSSSS